MATLSTRVLSNKRVSVRIGPDTAIADYQKPTLAEYASLTEVSEATKWDGFDFNIDASDQSDSRSLTDEAGAQSRSYIQFGGDIEFFTPKPTDTSSILRTTRNIVKVPRTKLAVAIRTVTLNSVGAAVGDEINAYRVITDANRHNRSDTDYSYTVKFVAQDDVGVNRIIPSVAPTAVALTPSAPVTTTIGSVGFHTAAYEGRNVTVGAVYTSSDPAKLEALPSGAWRAIAAGTASITATYPGSAVGVAKTYTIS